jgi:hypothetical protein
MDKKKGSTMAKQEKEQESHYVVSPPFQARARLSVSDMPFWDVVITAHSTEDLLAEITTVNDWIKKNRRHWAGAH